MYYLYPGYKSIEEIRSKVMHIDSCFLMYGTEGISNILINNQYWLFGNEASNTLNIIPVDPASDPDYSDISFISDCLAFEHEIPFLAYPDSSKIKIEDLPWLLKEEWPTLSVAERYLSAITEALESAATMVNGSLFTSVFKYDWYYGASTTDYDDMEIVQVNFSKYENVRNALHTYNVALRQIDPLVSYLNYYRVIESINQSNGKNWIKGTLTKKEIDFNEEVWGVIENKRNYCFNDIKKHLRSDNLDLGELNSAGYRKINLNELIRANGLTQLERLQNEGFTVSQITSRLYNENRCGIAHGKDIKYHDLSDNYFEVLRDLKLIKFLARYSIYQKVNS